MSQNDPTASAAQAAGTAWLAGHLNHLTDEQEEKLTAFKKLCEERGYYQSEAAAKEGKASHTDETMLYVSRSSWGCLSGVADLLGDIYARASSM